jgi:hypothetical protein
MKRLRLAAVFLLAFLLTGCIQDYKVTEEKDDAIAEYMAGLLLGSDDDYDQELIPLEEIEGNTASVTKSPEDENSVQGEDADTSDTTEGADETADSGNDNSAVQGDYTLSELIGVNNLDIQYTGFEVAETYPENSKDSYFSIDSREGYQLLVIKLSVENKSEKSVNLNLSDSDISYQLDLGGETINKPQVTFLENDLQFIDVTIKGGDKTDALLIFEIAKKVDLTNINLIVSNGKKSKIVNIE